MLILLAAPLSFGQQDPNALVQRMVAHELMALKDHSHWMYLDEQTDDSGAQLKEVVDTDQGSLALLVAEDGHPVTGPQEQKEIAQLKKTAGDPDQLEKQRQQSDEDARKAVQMLKILPKAFRYTIEDDSADSIRLRFRPDPNFDPPSREAKVFHAMVGEMVIDKSSERLKELAGQLDSDVTFGWGILGRLQKGGTFHIRQKEVGPGHWELTLLDVHMNGKAILFKSIREQQHEVRSHFRAVPEKLSPEQAAAMLIESAEQKRYAAQNGTAQR